MTERICEHCNNAPADFDCGDEALCSHCASLSASKRSMDRLMDRARRITENKRRRWRAREY